MLYELLSSIYKPVCCRVTQTIVTESRNKSDTIDLPQSLQPNRKSCKDAI